MYKLLDNSPLLAHFKSNLGQGGRKGASCGRDKSCYNQVMVNRLIILFSLVALIVIMVMLNLTSPAEIGPLGVLVFFTMIYIVVLGVATGLVALMRRVTGHKNGMRRKDYFFAAVIAFGPIMLLLVQSFGSFSLWTVGLTVMFVVLGCFLVSKRT